MHVFGNQMDVLQKLVEIIMMKKIVIQHMVVHGIQQKHVLVLHYVQIMHFKILINVI